MDHVEQATLLCPPCRYTLTHVSHLLVGTGSWLFHMTLRYDMQLLDEIPMMFSAAIHTYALLQVGTISNGYRKWTRSSVLYW